MFTDLIKNAYSEDIPNGDLTTRSLGLQEKFGIAHIVAKQNLVMSGTELATACLHYCDPELAINWHFKDSDNVLSGQRVAQISGNLVQLIQAERVALNFLGYLSGIATETRRYVDACKGTRTQILDTRKTLPLYRALAKKAVVDGGGRNHRMNLSDAILIKENHGALAGGLRFAIEKISSQTPLAIEVEVGNLDEVRQVMNLPIARIMFDNMDTATMAEAIKIIPPKIATEASGNMTLPRIPEVAATGVNFISVGALTHSVKNADFSLLFEWD